MTNDGNLLWQRVTFWQRLRTACLLPSALMSYICCDEKGQSLGIYPQPGWGLHCQTPAHGIGLLVGKPEVKREAEVRVNLCINSYSPALSPTYTQANFHQFTTPEAPPCAAPPAGRPAVSVGYTLQPEPASDSPKSPRTPHINLTGQTPREESNFKCPEALPAESVLVLTTMCIQLPYSPSYLSLDSL